MPKQKQEKIHVSFSEIKTYSDCPHKHYLQYIEGHKKNTAHNMVGNFVHEAIDRKIKGNSLSWVTMGKNIFRWIKENPQADKWTKKRTRSDLYDPKDWVKSALKIYGEVFDWLEENFPKCNILYSELKFNEPIPEEKDSFKYKGFIDLVLKDKDGKYHICDFKVTTSGWYGQRRHDTHKEYQITLYKFYFCQKMGINLNEVSTHFILLKRHVPEGKSCCELITVTSGLKKTENAKLWVNKNLRGIKKGLKFKNRKSCTFCDFKGTKLCP